MLLEDAIKGHRTANDLLESLSAPSKAAKRKDDIFVRTYIVGCHFRTRKRHRLQLVRNGRRAAR